MNRILLLEDDVLARWTCRKNLEAFGCVVTEAENCARANELIQSTEIDAMVLDHRLPDGFGIDVLRQLRERGGRQKAIYLTAETEEISDELRRELSLSAVLSKPVVFEELRSTLTSALGGGGDEADSLDEAALPMAGRFLLLPVPVDPDAEEMTILSRQCRHVAWVALDMSRTCRLGDEVFDVVAELAGACRELGGRLCIMGLSPELQERVRDRRMEREFDLVADRAALEAAGRRLSSAGERAALLDSVVPRNAG